MNMAADAAGIPIAGETEVSLSPWSVRNLDGPSLLDVATRKRGLLDTRIKDSVQMMELVVKSLRERGDGASPSKSDPFVWREKERQYRELLEDCERLIGSFQTELNTLPDPSNIRGDSTLNLLDRLRGMIGGRDPVRGREMVLLAERLVKSESALLKLRDRERLLVEELMAAETQRDEAKRLLREKEMNPPAPTSVPSAMSATTPLSTVPQATNPPFSSTAPLPSSALPSAPLSSTMPLLSKPTDSAPFEATTPLSTTFALASARYGLTPTPASVETPSTAFHTHSQAEINDIIRTVREKVDRLKGI